MASKATKAAAKYNALRLTSTMLFHIGSSSEVFENLEGLPQELLEELEKEVSNIIESLNKRADKLNQKFGDRLPDLVEMLLNDPRVKGHEHNDLTDR